MVIFENEKYWRMAHINLEGVVWGGGVGGKLITKEGFKKTIMCIEPDINFRIPD